LAPWLQNGVQHGMPISITVVSVSILWLVQEGKLEH